MKRIVALLVVLGMVAAMLPMKAQAGIIEHEPEIHVGLEYTSSNSTSVNNYGFDAPLEYDGGRVVYLGSSCHVTGRVTAVNVTDIEVSIDKWFPGTYVDGQTSDWQGTFRLADLISVTIALRLELKRLSRAWLSRIGVTRHLLFCPRRTSISRTLRMLSLTTLLMLSRLKSAAL